METYLVGGAVRDQLLGIPVHERDWVIVGATPTELLAQGYLQVGKDFPVFLHPTTNEEYALARTERKTGLGYHGFICHSAPDVSLEEDLLRRDLTINAIAQTPDGHRIDPYGGENDIHNRILRHVSPAFAEDPLRVLRIARFRAKLSPFGFQIAAETQRLLLYMVQQGQLSELSPERIWLETEKALATPNPVVYFQTLREIGASKVLFPEWDALFGIPSDHTKQPDIDCGSRCLAALANASQLTTDKSTRFAALVHLLGHYPKRPSAWLHKNKHIDRVPLQQFKQRYKIAKQYEQLADLTIQFHSEIIQASNADADMRLHLLEQLDAYRRPDRFKKIIIACQAIQPGDFPTVPNHQTVLSPLCQAYHASKDVTYKPPKLAKTGEAIKAEVRRLRKLAIEQSMLAN